MKRPERDDLMNELKIGCVGSVHMTLNFLLQHFLYRSSKQYKSLFVILAAFFIILLILFLSLELIELPQHEMPKQIILSMIER